MLLLINFDQVLRTGGYEAYSPECVEVEFSEVRSIEEGRDSSLLAPAWLMRIDRCRISAVSSDRFFAQNTVAFLVLLCVDLASSETLPQGLLSRALTPGVHAPIEAHSILPVGEDLDDRPNHDNQHEQR